MDVAKTYLGQPVTYKRLIARLDFKDESVIKGIQLDGLRVVGSVDTLTQKYYSDGIDEILLVDAVASLYEKSTLVNLIRKVTQNCFVPITVGGGVRDIETADELFRAGADKIAVNTAAIRNPGFISEVAKKYGSQAVVVHVEAKWNGSDWICYTENGREPSGLSAGDWVRSAEKLGAGEFLLTSIDRDGTKSGPDFDLIGNARTCTSLPIVASSGFRSAVQIHEALGTLQCQGVAVASMLHYGVATVLEIKEELQLLGTKIRR